MTSKDDKHKLNPIIYEEAADWIVDLREGEVDAQMRERLDAWFRTSPEHIRAYLELSSIWEEGADPDLDRGHTTDGLISLIKSPSNVVALNAPTMKVIVHESETFDQSAEARAIPNESTVANFLLGRRHRLGRRVWLSAGVVVCAVAMLAVYVRSERNVTFATETGEQRFEKLVDGSTVELNSKSRVQIRFSDHERNVDLIEGQALFHVAKDASRPFIVRSDATLIRAVGTQFDVYRKPTGTVVTVVEGRVAVLSPWLTTKPEARAVSPEGSTDVSPKGPRAATSIVSTDRSASPLPAGLVPAEVNGGTLFLSAGEQVTVGAVVADPRPAHTDTAAATAWTQHELVFESTPLKDVAEEFNRYNTRRLVVSDTAVQTIHITGVFSSADPASLIKFLCAQKDVAVFETERDIRISKK